MRAPLHYDNHSFRRRAPKKTLEPKSSRQLVVEKDDERSSRSGISSSKEGEVKPSSDIDVNANYENIGRRTPPVLKPPLMKDFFKTTDDSYNKEKGKKTFFRQMCYPISGSVGFGEDIDEENLQRFDCFDRQKC